MANRPMGDEFWGGSVGVVRLEYDNFDYGYTLDNTEIERLEDTKDIFAAQEGTQRFDIVRTGVGWNVLATFVNLDAALIAKLQQGVIVSGAGSSTLGKRSLYQSMKDNEAKRLRLKRVDSEGNSYADPKYWFTAYLAGVIITSNVMYGPDNQRVLSVTFPLFKDDTKEAYWYTGFESSLGL